MMEAGALIAGRYQLLERISKGGMGSVWKAHHLQLDVPVAIKFMHPRLLEVPEARMRFEREAKAAARIRSPHVVHVYDHGIEESGAPYIVMELLEGEDLETRLRRVRTLPPAQAARLCDQVCKGLSRAHALGIVHRDLKPANVFLVRAEDDLAKLVDFGVAKETAPQRVVPGETTAGTLVGTPHYMSPEQARGQELDSRSDLWSLAAILFRALTGRRPFSGSDFGDIAVRVCTDPIPSASALDGRLGPAVDGFFQRAFERDRDGRFQTAEQLAVAFENALTHEDVSKPVAARERTSAPPRTVVTTPERSSRGLWLLGIIMLAGPASIMFFWDELHMVVDRSPPVPSVSSADPRSERARAAWEELYTHVRSNDIPQAVDSLARLVEIEPAAASDKRNTILDLAERALVRKDGTSARMAELMTHGMGEHGPDLLFDLMATRSKTKAAAEAKRLLADPAVRSRGSKDMNHAYAIHTAKSCPEKRTQVLRAKAEGGARTLREIRALTSECTSCCFRDDVAVKATEAAIAAR